MVKYDVGKKGLPHVTYIHIYSRVHILQAMAPQQAFREVVRLLALLLLAALIIAVKITIACGIMSVNIQGNGFQRWQGVKSVVQNELLERRPDVGDLQASEGAQLTDASLHKAVTNCEQLIVQPYPQLLSTPPRSKPAISVSRASPHQRLDTNVPSMDLQLLQLSRCRCRM
jgi:hypothetical protein